MKTILFILFFPLSLLSQSYVDIGRYSFEYEYSEGGEITTPWETKGYTQFVEDICRYAAEDFNGLITLDDEKIFIIHGERYFVNGEEFENLKPAIIYLTGLLHKIKLK